MKIFQLYTNIVILLKKFLQHLQNPSTSATLQREFIILYIRYRYIGKTKLIDIIYYFYYD